LGTLHDVCLIKHQQRCMPLLSTTMCTPSITDKAAVVADTKHSCGWLQALPIIAQVCKQSAYFLAVASF